LRGLLLLVWASAAPLHSNNPPSPMVSLAVMPSA